MLKINAKVRKNIGKTAKDLRKKGVLPGVLYGAKIKNISLEVDEKKFVKVYKETGKSSMVTLVFEGGKEKAMEYLVMIKDEDRDPLTDRFLHVDFYQPDLEKEIEVHVPLIFEGASLAVKDLGGTFIKNISEVEVKARPQDLPKEIKVNIDGLKTLEDKILIKDLKVAPGIKILKNPDEIIASIASLENIEEELAEPIEEKVEDVQKVEEKKKDEDEGEGGADEKGAKKIEKKSEAVKDSKKK